MEEYDEIADWYAANRRPEVGVPDVADFARALAPGSKVLDLGCGNGIPISELLVRSGFELFGIDSSEEMIARFQRTCPGAHVQCASIRDSDFFGAVFDGVVAWGVLFHLSPSDQEEAIAKVSRALTPGGRFLFTAGDQEGTVESEMNGVLFRYLSLGAPRYRTLLGEHEFDLLDEHRDAWDNYVFLAQKRPHLPLQPTSGSDRAT
ncbi:MAG: class I SAM-dependent DNA methyltransferase [Acidobacteriota bacterium]